MFFIVILLTFSFWAIMDLNRKAIKLETKYPIIDCPSIYETYQKEMIEVGGVQISQI